VSGFLLATTLCTPTCCCHRRAVLTPCSTLSLSLSHIHVVEPAGAAAPPAEVPSAGRPQLSDDRLRECLSALLAGPAELKQQADEADNASNVGAACALFVIVLLLATDGTVTRSREQSLSLVSALLSVRWQMNALHGWKLYPRRGFSAPVFFHRRATRWPEALTMHARHAQVLFKQNLVYLHQCHDASRFCRDALWEVSLNASWAQ
jgi:hypothetical protein